MRKTTSKRLICLALSVLMFATAMPTFVSAAEATVDASTGKTTLQEISEDKKQLVVLASTEKRDIPIMVETKDVKKQI